MASFCTCRCGYVLMSLPCSEAVLVMRAGFHVVDLKFKQCARGVSDTKAND